MTKAEHPVFPVVLPPYAVRQGRKRDDVANRERDAVLSRLRWAHPRSLSVEDLRVRLGWPTATGLPDTLAALAADGEARRDEDGRWAATRPGPVERASRREPLREPSAPEPDPRKPVQGPTPGVLVVDPNAWTQMGGLPIQTGYSVARAGQVLAWLAVGRPTATEYRLIRWLRPQYPGVGELEAAVRRELLALRRLRLVEDGALALTERGLAVARGWVPDATRVTPSRWRSPTGLVAVHGHVLSEQWALAWTTDARPVRHAWARRLGGRCLTLVDARDDRERGCLAVTVGLAE